MSVFYLPGCHFTEYDPQASKALIAFAKEYLNANILGCCSKQYDKPNAGDTVIYVCPTCALIMSEANPSVKLISLYEVLADIPSLHKQALSWINLEEKELTVQDCWRTRNNQNMQNAVRSILSKMNAKVVELENNFEKATYCGTSLLSKPSSRYELLAPNLFNDPIFKPCSEQEQIVQLEQHAKSYTTSEIICYCTGCIEGIEKLNAYHEANAASEKIGGSFNTYKPIHLASLIAQCVKTYRP